MRLPKSIERLINEFSKLPGVGPKSAQRLALYLLKKSNPELELLSEAIQNLKAGVLFCDICHNMAETNPCGVCSDPAREKTVLCVVEEPLDAVALDKSGSFQGQYHILGGALNPLEGLGPEHLHLESLKNRVTGQGVTELILATNPTLEGEATAMYIAKMFTGQSVKITRIARGLPMGGQLEYADDITLSRALEGRKEF